MSRVIKFRAWDKRRSEWVALNDLMHDLWAYMQGDHEVMQFTGLQDKNGTEIYEGDIVTDGYHEKYGRYEVRWDEIGWNFRSTDGRELEVIGNIYENRDLRDEVAS